MSNNYPCSNYLERLLIKDDTNKDGNTHFLQMGRISMFKSTCLSDSCFVSSGIILTFFSILRKMEISTKIS